MTRRGVAVASAGAAAIIAIEGVWFVLEPGGARLAAHAGNAASFVVAFVAGSACLVAARRAGRHPRRGWVLLGVAAWSWSAGQGVRIFETTVLDEPATFPGFADVGHLGLVPLGVAAVLSFVAGETSRIARLRALIDSLILGVTLVLVGWVLALSASWDPTSVGVLEQSVAIGYPAGHLMLAAFALFLFAHGSRGTRASAGLVAAGLLLLSGTTSGSLYWRLTDGSTPVLANLGWASAFALLTLGAFSRATVDRADAERPVVGAAARARLWAPNLAVVVAVGVVCAVQIVEGSLEPLAFWAAVVLVLLFVARQFLTTSEVLTLKRGLESTVEARTMELSESESRFRSLVEHSTDVVTIVDPETLVVRYASESVGGVFGYDASELRGRRLFDAIHGDDRSHVEAVAREVGRQAGSVADLNFRFRHRDGTWRRAEATVKNLLYDPAVRGLVLNTRDITDRVRLEEQLAHQAFHDTLTGLPNRALFTDRVEQAIARSTRSGVPVTVLYVDLDGFKVVNDTYGHETGDALLVAVADRMGRSMRTADTVARFGGDEFAILLADAPGHDGGARVAERLLALFDVPFSLEHRELMIGASVGIADAASGLEDAGDLMRNAEVAMYRAKSRGRNRFEQFDPAVHAGVTDRLALASELRQAVERQQFFVEYQPVVDIRSGGVEAVEALVRWRHPERGVVPPSEFIPLAEESGIVGAIGSFVLREAVSRTRRWQLEEPGCESLAVNVNLSAWQIRQAGIVDEVARVLAEAGLRPEDLTLEITESVLMDDDDEVRGRLEHLRVLGVGLAIDDFGTGYSSLSYLQKFPIDTIKIDRSFINGLGRGPEDSALARAIIKLGTAFRLRTVAEGIENAEQAALLRQMGCHLGQGFHFAPPLDAERLAEYVAEPHVRRGRRSTAKAPRGSRVG